MDVVKYLVKKTNCNISECWLAISVCVCFYVTAFLLVLTHDQIACLFYFVHTEAESLSGRTPLQEATHSGHTAIAQYLNSMPASRPGLYYQSLCMCVCIHTHH